MSPTSSLHSNDERKCNDNTNNNQFQFPSLSTISTKKKPFQHQSTTSLDNKENSPPFQTKLQLSTYNSKNSITKTPVLEKRKIHSNVEHDSNYNMNNNNTNNHSEEAVVVVVPSTKKKGSRVIRYGETIDSFFCLHEATSNEHRNVCHDVAYGDKVDDSSSWLIVLNEATTFVANNNNNTSSSQLIRLHKRATSRMLLSRKYTNESIRKNILSIWLSYAYATACYGSCDDANQIYKLILNNNRSNSSVGDYAELYVAISNFEKNNCNDLKAAREYLEMGLTKGALPCEMIQTALEELNIGINCSSSAHMSHSSSLGKYSAALDSKQQSFVVGEIIVDTLESCSNRNVVTVDDISQKNNIGSNNVMLRSKNRMNDLKDSKNVTRSKLSSLPRIPSIPGFIKSDDKKVVKHLESTSDMENKVLEIFTNECKDVNNHQEEQKKLKCEEVYVPELKNDTKDVSTRKDENRLNEVKLVGKNKKLFIPSSTNAPASVPQFPSLRSKLGIMEKISPTGEEQRMIFGAKVEPVHKETKKEVSGKKMYESGDDFLRYERKSSENKEKFAPSKDEHSSLFENNRSNQDRKRKLFKVESNVGIKSNQTNSKADTSNRYQSSLLLRKKTRLFSAAKPLRLGGKAARVSAQNNYAEEEDSQFDENRKGSCSSVEETSSIHSTKSSETTAKLSKVDLSYMIKWEPQRKFNDVQSEIISSTKQPKCNYLSQMEVIVEETPSQGHSVTGSLVPSLAKRKSVGENSYHGRRESSGSGPKELTPSKLKKNRDSASPYLEGTDLSNSNLDFLPVMAENNMLRVKGIAYAKLGVIGKGGSCKVYRALTKDCKVLAIKKVKLNGMEKKAIEGYANEIALLKRLAGNHSIIQLFDSEVDLERKAIFLVMELGDVDLNHVLKQQVDRVDGGNNGRHTLSINFIRITWEQMLSAVHSIHEERIIHGDLKPANFLFVRGTLKLIDFGIAKAIQTDDTTNIYRDNHVGTLNYMSPEAILDDGSGGSKVRMRLGRASDIWSLGCILYQMVYGKTPFANLHMIQKLQAIVNPEHKISYPASNFEDDKAVLDAIQLCLQRNPTHRPPIVGVNGLLNGHWFLNKLSCTCLR